MRSIANKYSGHTWSILLGMIMTGAARSIIVKLAYQSGFRAPLTITLLYLLGQSLSLFVYGLNNLLLSFYYKEASKSGDDDQEQKSGAYQSPSLELGTAGGYDGTPTMKQNDRCTIHEDYALTPTKTDSGSVHGLTRESEATILWIHKVPFYLKPAIPAVLNLLNSALRWASLLYIDASVAEMLISGLELTLSVVAARIFRKRIVAKARWVGVIIVTFGVIIIERADKSEEEDKDADNESGRADDVTMGVILIILQSVLSALQDLGEELFMQAADFPALLMLGLEGLIGFCIGLIIYLTAGDQFKIEDIDSTMSMLSYNAKLRWWIVGLPFLFLVTGIFNIKATEVTSAMTRNVWKNMRTVLVWAVGLAIYYLGSGSLGEAWHVPQSFVILFGFLVMSSGIVVYYSVK